MKQKIFTEEFDNSLIYDIEDNLPKYKSGDFGNLKEVENEWSVECSGELLEKMLPYAVSGASNEFPAAEALYEEYQHLTPVEASYKPFWHHLSHVELLPYMIKRWPDIQKPGRTNDENVRYIKDHWFNSSIVRNQLEGLYWMVRRSVIKEENGSNNYTLTRFLFSRTKLGNRGLAASKLFSYENAVHGILRFYMENENTLLTPHFEEKTDYCIQLLNQTGAVVELSLWTPQDFYDFLDAHREQINRSIDRKVQKRLDEEKARGQLELNIE